MVSADTFTVSIQRVCFLELVITYVTDAPVIYSVEFICTVSVCNNVVSFLESIITRIVTVKLLKNVDVLVATPAPGAYVVTISSGSRYGGKLGNISFGQSLTQIGIDLSGAQYIAIHIKESYSKLVLYVSDSKVGEMGGSKGQGFLVLYVLKHIFHVCTNVVYKCVVSTLVLCCERNGDAGIAAIEFRADQRKGIHLGVTVECGGCRPLCLFAVYARNVKRDLVSGSLILHTAQSSVVKQNCHRCSTILVARNNHLQADFFKLSSDFKYDRGNYFNGGPAADTVIGIRAKGQNQGVTFKLEVAIGSEVRNSFKCTDISSMLGSCNDLGSPTCEHIGVLKIHGLSGFVDHGHFAVINYHFVLFTFNDKGDGCGVNCLVGSVTGNSRKRTGNQVTVLVLPALEIQSGKSTIMVGNGAQLVDIRNFIVQNLKDNGVRGVLCIYNDILAGHGGNFLTILIYPSKISIVKYCILAVRSKLCTVGQEALKYSVALLINKGNLIQVSNVHEDGNVRGNIASRNKVTQNNGLAKSSHTYMIKYVLEPCAGIIGSAERKAEFTVTLVGIGQLSILELFGDLVINQIDYVVDTVVSRLCLSRIRDAALILGKCLNHAAHDFLSTRGIHIQLACNMCSSLIKQFVTNQCISILDLGQSCQIIVADHLRQRINGLDGKGSFLIRKGCGSLFNQDLTKLLDHAQCGTCSFQLFKQSLFGFIHCLDMIAQIIHNLCELIIAQQIKQLVQLANGSTLADTLDDHLLGFIGNACTVERTCQNSAECTGNVNLDAQITIGVHDIVICSKESTGSSTNCTEVTAQSNSELDLTVSLAICTQNYIIGCQNAVITDVCNIAGRYGINQQCILQACGRNDFAVVTCLQGVQHVNQLGNAVALDCKYLVAVYGYGIDLAVIDLGSTCLQESNDCLLICAVSSRIAHVADHVADNLIVVACVNVYVQRSNTALINHFVLAMVYGQSVYVSNNLLYYVHNSTVDYDIVTRSKQIGCIPLDVIARRYIHLASGDQLLVRDLCTLNLFAVNHPDNGVGHVLICRIGVNLRIDRIDDLISGSAVLNSIYNLIDVTDHFVIDKHVVNHGIKLFLCLCLIVSTQDRICGFFERFVRCILLFNIILQLVSSVRIILHTVVLVDEVDERTQILACKRGQSRVFCSERGDSDYRGKHCQTQHCNKHSATKLSVLLHWSFPPN